MLTRQEMDALVGKTLIIREFPHICLAAGDDALLLLQIAVKDESFIRKGQPIKYIVAHYPEFQGDKLVWGQGEYYDIWAYRENDSLAGRKLSVAMLNDGNGTRCAGVFTTATRAETWLEKSIQVDADAHTWVETKHVNRPEKDY